MINILTQKDLELFFSTKRDMSVFPVPVSKYELDSNVTGFLIVEGSYFYFLNISHVDLVKNDLNTILDYFSNQNIITNNTDYFYLVGIDVSGYTDIVNFRFLDDSIHGRIIPFNILPLNLLLKRIGLTIDKTPTIINDKNFIYLTKAFYNLRKYGIGICYEFKTNSYRPVAYYKDRFVYNISKDDEFWMGFVQEGSKLIEFDFKSYAFQLLNIIGYSVPLDIYISLGNIYAKDGEDIRLKGKKAAFKLLYKEDVVVPDFDFLSELRRFKLAIKDEMRRGYLTSPLTGRKIPVVENGNVAQFIQCIETEYNSMLLEEIHDLLLPYKSKIVHYIFDSFIFQIYDEELMEVGLKLKNLLKSKKLYFKYNFF